MATESVMKTIAKDSEISLKKAKIAANSLCAGINHCLENAIFTLDWGMENKGWSAGQEFILAGRRAAIRVVDIGHGELSIVVGVPSRSCNNPFAFLYRNAGLRDGYDLLCTGWLERKTGKFLQGVLTCNTKNQDWNNGLAELPIEPVGYAVSNRFFP